MKNLSQNEAIEKILNNEKVENYYIESLDLSEKELPSLYLKNCRIDNINLVNSTIKGEAIFTGTKFLKAYFGWKSPFNKQGKSVFESKVDFNEAIFEGEACFGGVIFQSLVSFKNTVFYNNTIFRDSTFEEQVYFWETIFKENCDFKNTKFKTEAHFDNSKFYKNFDGAHINLNSQELSLNNILVEGDFNLSDSTINGYLSLKKSKINGDFNLSNSNIIDEANFENTIFNKCLFRSTKFNKKVSFINTIFRNKVIFLDTIFNNEAIFLNSQFEEEVFFNYDCNTRASLKEKNLPSIFENSADFTNVKFQKRVVFEEVTFKKSATFSNAYFGEQANFMNTRFSGLTTFNNIYCNNEFNGIGSTFGELNLDYSNINRRLDLTNSKFNLLSFYKAAIDLIVIEKDQVINKLVNEQPNTKHYDRLKEEYLILKESFSKRGMHEEEDWAYRKFKQSQRKYNTILAWYSLIGKKNKYGKIKSLIILLWNFLENILIDKGTGYATRPFNITILALSFILLFAGIYTIFQEGLVKPVDNLNFYQSIYFSFATFTTMGFGDIHPKLDSSMKYVVSAEAFIGLFIMTLFVGTYTRKIIR